MYRYMLVLREPTNISWTNWRYIYIHVYCITECNIYKKNVPFPEMYRALYCVREHLYDNKITYIHISNGFNNLYFSCMYTTFKKGCFDWHWCHWPFLLFFCIKFCAMFRYSNSVENIPFLNPLDIANIKLWRIIQRKRRIFTFINLCLDPL